MFPWNLMPFNKVTQKKFLEMKPDEIEQYVKQMMGQMLDPNMKGMIKPDEWLKEMEGNLNKPNETHGSIKAEIFETHDFVFVRIQLKEEEWLQKMKLLYTSNQVIIEHVPEYSDKHTLVLPSIVKRKGAAATHKEGILEVKLPKHTDHHYSEIELS